MQPLVSFILTKASLHSPAKISIITVCYNAATVLTYTIDSVLQQRYSHIEYIIIDGASKDESVALIKGYGSAITHWVSEPDKGIYDAMNKGLKLATGEYVIFMNAGDTFYDEQTLNHVFSTAENADIYYGQTRLIDMNRKDAGERWLLAPDELNWKSFKQGMLVSHQAIFVRRSIAPLYDLQYRLSADVDWVIKCLKQAKSIKNTQSYICKYLVGGASKQSEMEALKERFTIMKKHYGLLSTIVFHFFFIVRLPFRN